MILRLTLFVLGCALVAACSGAQVASVDQLPKADGQRHTLPGSRASIVIPKDFRIADATTWIWPLGQERNVIVHVQRAQEPEMGAMAWLDKTVADMEKQGAAGVERDQRVLLGDLDGRLLEAIELRSKPPNALWQLMTVAEDGMWTVTAAGPADALRQRRTVVEAFLLSLRIEAPDGGRRLPQQAPEHDLDLPAEVTPVQP